MKTSNVKTLLETSRSADSANPTDEKNLVLRRLSSMKGFQISINSSRISGNFRNKLTDTLASQIGATNEMFVQHIGNLLTLTVVFNLYSSEIYEKKLTSFLKGEFDKLLVSKY